jgi:hypothetical protein
MKIAKELLIKYFTYLKILKDRAMGWTAVFNLIMLSIIFIKSFNYSSFGLLTFIGGILAVIIITILDFVYILPKEQEYYLTINPEWNKLIKKE